MAVTLFYVANILYCLAYVVRDMVRLRAITIVAAFATFPYFLAPEQPLWEAIAWQTAFAGINIVNLTHLLLQRRPVEMTEDQRHLHQFVFRGLTARQAKKLMEAGEWVDVPSGGQLVERGSSPDCLMVIARGTCDVTVDDRLAAQLMPGRFIAEMSFLSDEPASADVRSAGDSRVLRWARGPLKELMDRTPMYREYLHALLGLDLTRTLRDTGTFMPGRDY